MNPALIEALLVERHEMLRSIENDIPLALYTAITEKMAYERSYLREACERCVKSAEASERFVHTLPSEYFVRRPLPVDMF